MGEPDQVAVDEIPTALLGGRLQLYQRAGGHRAGTDAVLLAAAADPQAGARIVDVGSGVGTVGLALALREPTASVLLVEVDPDAAALARRNITLNDRDRSVAVAEIDVFERDARAEWAGTASLVVSNPPFFEAGAMRPSPDAGKRGAHMLPRAGEHGSHGDWLRAAMSFLAPHGHLVMIHRPDALAALLAASEGRLGNITVRPIHPRAGEPATRVLFGGIAGSRAPLSLAAPLVLHEATGVFQPDVEAVHRGSGFLPLLRNKKADPEGRLSVSSKQRS